MDNEFNPIDYILEAKDILLEEIGRLETQLKIDIERKETTELKLNQEIDKLNKINIFIEQYNK